MGPICTREHRVDHQVGVSLFDHVQPGMGIYNEEIMTR